jgi:glyoxylase I family protein
LSSNIFDIHHASLLVSDVGASLEFYCDVLGLEVSDARPDLGYPGVWLVIGQHQLHLMQLPNPDSVDGRPPHGGRDHHVALAVYDLSQIQNRLDQRSIAYTLSKSGRTALFVRDRDANAIELIEC